MVDDWAAPTALPAPYLPLFSHRKSTGSFHSDARLKVSGMAPSSSAPSPNRHTAISPAPRLLAAYAAPAPSGKMPPTTPEHWRNPNSRGLVWKEPPLPRL